MKAYFSPYPFITLCAAASLLAGCQNVNDALQTGVDQVTDAVASAEPPHLPSQQERESDKLMAKGACPFVDVVGDLSDYYEYAPGSRGGPEDLVTHVRLRRVEAMCEYGRKSVTVDLKLNFVGLLGEQGRAHAGDVPFFSLPFFVAVTAPGGKVLAKEVFAASMSFDGGQTEHVYEEKLRQIIPLANPDTGARYRVVAGFQLSPEQLAYNRSLISQEEKRVADEALRQRKIQSIRSRNDNRIGGAGTLPVEDSQEKIILAPAPEKPR